MVKAVGPEVSLFQPGDEVIYAGSINRPGTNAQFHLVDERIVGRKPRTLDWAEALLQATDENPGGLAERFLQLVRQTIQQAINPFWSTMESYLP